MFVGLKLEGVETQESLESSVEYVENLIENQNQLSGTSYYAVYYTSDKGTVYAELWEPNE